MEKEFKGKAIYNPSGKAGEYSYWACNFHKGCINGCTYCYLKKGLLAGALGGNKVELKQCFADENDALKTFENELLKNADAIRPHGLFFTFTSDPLLPETFMLTYRAVEICQKHRIPVKILSKRVDTLPVLFEYTGMLNWDAKIIAIGQTLTGCDDVEPNASPNQARCNGLYNAKSRGFRTFASIEPVIDFRKSMSMIVETDMYCDHYKIGLESGRKYKKADILEFVERVNGHIVRINRACEKNITVYWKYSILKQCGIDRRTLPGHCVQRDYNIFQ